MTVSAKEGINLGGMMDNSAVFIFFVLLLPDGPAPALRWREPIKNHF